MQSAGAGMMGPREAWVGGVSMYKGNQCGLDARAGGAAVASCPQMGPHTGQSKTTKQMQS